MAIIMTPKTMGSHACREALRYGLFDINVAMARAMLTSSNNRWRSRMAIHKPAAGSIQIAA